MAQRVTLDEGGTINVHARIKDMCKEARNHLGLTNQEICDLISDRFGIEDFSVNTVNNFFSERSKATTIYTTGYICAVLNISIDAVFDIKSDKSTLEDTQLYKELATIRDELRFKDQMIQNLEVRIQEKDNSIEQVRLGLEHYRQVIDANSRKVQPWVFVLTLSLLIAVIIIVIVYLLIFDLTNPNYGIFRNF